MQSTWGPHEHGPTDRGGGGGGGNMNRAGSGNMYRAGSGSGRGAGGGNRYRAGSAPKTLNPKPRASVLGLPSRASGLQTQGSGPDGNQGAHATAYKPNCMLHLVWKGTASDRPRGSTCQ